ncbi:hypothetical protein [Roseovarius salis]|uniref:hypothetical protein n=1 Tax=Roseovarius salis TaxID=3376063 RepID=UPI0037C826E0
MARRDVPFEAPWHAAACAIADKLVQDGIIAPDEWSAALGAERSRQEREGAADTADTYHEAVLAALVALLERKEGISADALSELERQWCEAYRVTPHGAPVRLD